MNSSLRLVNAAVPRYLTTSSRRVLCQRECKRSLTTATAQPPNPPLTTQSGIQKHTAPSPTGLTNVQYTELLSEGKIQLPLQRRVPHKFCTKVQLEAMAPIAQGRDVLLRTGDCTGRSSAYLVPLFSRYLHWSLPDSLKKPGIKILIVAPTSDRAQELEERVNMFAPHKGAFNVWRLPTKWNLPNERAAVLARRTDVLIVTYGRLLDHLVSTPNFKSKLQDLKCVVYDDADAVSERVATQWVPTIAKHLPSRAVLSRQTVITARKDSAQLQKVVDLLLPERYTSVVV